MAMHKLGAREICASMPNSFSIENRIVNQQDAQHWGNSHKVIYLQMPTRDRKSGAEGRYWSFVVVEGGGKGDEP